MPAKYTPAAVSRSLATVGEHVRTWRKLNRVTQALLAERAGVSVPTVQALEAGRPVSTDTLARVLRGLGVLDMLTGALDPMNTDVGRLRAHQTLPERVRAPKAPR